LPLQFRNSDGSVGVGIIERDKFSNHLAYAHSAGGRARLKFVGGSSVDLDGAGIGHDGILE